MDIDDCLERLLDAVEANKYLEVESYAKKIISEIHNVRPNFRKELQEHLEGLIKSAQQEKYKQNLIDQILNQK